MTPALVTATPDSLRALGVGIDVEDGGGTCIQTARIPAGCFLGQHEHDHAHQAVLVSGRARLWIDDRARELSGFTVLTIEANRRHTVEAVTDAVWLCVWAIGEVDRAAIDATITRKAG